MQPGLLPQSPPRPISSCTSGSQPWPGRRRAEQESKAAKASEAGGDLHSPSWAWPTLPASADRRMLGLAASGWGGGKEGATCCLPTAGGPARGEGAEVAGALVPGQHAEGPAAASCPERGAAHRRRVQAPRRQAFERAQRSRARRLRQASSINVTTVKYDNKMIAVWSQICSPPSCVGFIVTQTRGEL